MKNPASSIAAVYLFLTSSLAAKEETSTAMTKILDDMSKHYGDGEFDRTYMDKLYKNFDKFDDHLLMESQEKAWEGILQYYKTDGTTNDAYNRPDTWHDGIIGAKNLLRKDTAFFGEGEDKYKVWQPCNYVSNVPYYHAVTRICDLETWNSNTDIIRAQKRSMA